VIHPPQPTPTEEGDKPLRNGYRQQIERRLLAIYLRDHLAGASGGAALARRLRDSNRGGPWGEPLERLLAEIEVDRETLTRVMERLEVRPDPIKIAAASIAEKLGRLKLNGRLRGYSPLSRLLELEILHLGIVGKADLWRALHESLPGELAEFDLPALIERAEAQRQSVQQLRLEAAAAAFGDST
jgi:hypothetical protein